MPWQHADGEPRGSDIAVALGRDKEGRFGVLFKDVAPFAPPDDLLTQLATTMHDPGASRPDLDNPAIPSGFTFFSQFVDHDLTRDTTPLTQQQQDPHAVTDFRTPRFDLDSVYGGGPTARPELYESDGVKLRVTGVGDPNVPDDLPRNPDGSALLGDPRNDENLIVCQVHVAFLKFHNRLVDLVRSQSPGAPDVFAQARRLMQWHYQWIVVHDFLPRIAGQSVVDQLLDERAGQPPKVKLAFYKPKNPNRPYMPIEFSVASYRFGHSIVRGGYLVSETSGGAIFSDPPSDGDLHGGRPIPPQFAIAFHNFFDIPGVPGPPHNLSRKIDTLLSAGLFALPVPGVVPDQPQPVIRSLAERNLKRGVKLGLPAGQDVAQATGVTPLSNQELGLTDARWGGKAPLWFYILKEAELQHGGTQLGDVGGRIVAEVFLGILDADHDSYLHARPDNFRPAPPIAPSGQFRMGDLLKFAGAA